LYYSNELLGTPPTVLASDVAISDQALTLTVAGQAQVGTLLQIDAEILSVSAVAGNGLQYSITRGVDSSTPATHSAATPVFQLINQTTIVPFPAGFFGSPYSGSWSYPISLPDVRVGSAELFVTNQLGNSAITGICMTHSQDNGLRTLSGGQYSIQVDGFLAIEQSVAPAIVVEAAHSVQDVFAILGTAADAQVQVQVTVNGAVYCTLTFAPGSTASNSILGSTLPPLQEMAQVTVAVLSVGQTNAGADLTVIIRL
jgi:hypothetical protein